MSPYQAWLVCCDAYALAAAETNGRRASLLAAVGAAAYAMVMEAAVRS